MNDYMKTLLEKLNQISYPSAFLISSLLTVVSILPLWLYVARQQTQLSIKAKEGSQKTVIAKPTDGPVPANPPIISRVYPWFGKSGDVIVIEGKNFGVYPKNRRLAIGDVIVADTAISLWSDTQIVASIPPAPTTVTNPMQGKPVSMRIDTHPMIESIPLTFYNEKTTVRLHKNGQTLTLTGATEPLKATLYTQNGKRDMTASPGTNNETGLFELGSGEAIYSVLITDEKGAPVPYAVNPTEFGF